MLDKGNHRPLHPGKIKLRLGDITGALVDDLMLGIPGNLTSEPFHLGCKSRDRADAQRESVSVRIAPYPFFATTGTRTGAPARVTPVRRNLLITRHRHAATAVFAGNIFGSTNILFLQPFNNANRTFPQLLCGDVVVSKMPRSARSRPACVAPILIQSELGCDGRRPSGCL
jgi:hypothetical protein